MLLTEATTQKPPPTNQRPYPPYRQMNRQRRSHPPSKQNQPQPLLIKPHQAPPQYPAQGTPQNRYKIPPPPTSLICPSMRLCFTPGQRTIEAGRRGSDYPCWSPHGTAFNQEARNIQIQVTATPVRCGGSGCHRPCFRPPSPPPPRSLIGAVQT